MQSMAEALSEISRLNIELVQANARVTAIELRYKDALLRIDDLESASYLVIGSYMAIAHGHPESHFESALRELSSLTTKCPSTLSNKLADTSQK